MEADPNRELGEGSGLVASTDMNDLSEDCVAKVVSFTTPCDAARVSSVSKLFKSAADSDPVWETFLPSDYRSLIPSSFRDMSKKELYLNLCDQPILIDDKKKSFSLEKTSGKKSYMLAPRDLYICWGDTPMYWDWVSLPESRFPEVAKLISVCWLEICGTINTRILSKETLYIAYFVFKLDDSYGFVDLPVEVAIERIGGKSTKRTVILDSEVRGTGEISSELNVRGDGWMEVKLGEVYFDGDMKEELKLIVLEIEYGKWKGGLIVEGFEIRPQVCL